MTTAGSSEMTITEHELQQCEQANASGRRPVVFVHGLWLLPSSWDRWAALFEPGTVPRCAPAAHLVAEVGVSGAGQSGQPQPRGPADLRAVPVRLRHAVSQDEAKHLYETYAVPTSGKPPAWTKESSSPERTAGTSGHQPREDHTDESHYRWDATLRYISAHLREWDELRGKIAISLTAMD
jgi:hypothetical protein